MEILFSEGLIKCLFATETFSIGINMPAKTVVFTNCRKWDGTENRWVTSGEYIQMSGRAGRRGKDDRGIVIQMMDEKMEPAVCKGILYGDPDPLNSSYHISYNMLLNMMRVEEVDPEFLIRASFHQYQQESESPGFDAQAEEYEEKAKEVKVDDEEVVGEYFTMKKQLKKIRWEITEVVREPQNIVPFLQPGRLIKVTQADGTSWGWAAAVTHRKKPGMEGGGESARLARKSDIDPYTIDVMVRCDPVKDGGADDGLKWKANEESRPFVAGQTEEGEKKKPDHRIMTLPLNTVVEISAVKIVMPADSHPKQARNSIGKSLREVNKAFPEAKGGLPLLDPVNDMKIRDDKIKTNIDRVEALTRELKAHKIAKFSPEDRAARLAKYEEKNLLVESARLMRKESAKAQQMVMKDELRRMKRVLKFMSHVDASGVIQLKGRTACEINTANELIVTELTFGGAFAEFTVEQTVALLR